MSEKRFIVESVMITNDCNEDKSRIVKVITDKGEIYSYDDLYEISDLLNEQQATIQSLKEENSNLNSILNEVGLQKPFIKILDDYMIEYDGSCFSMHKPSDIRSFVYLMNRNNNFDELQCEYNDESMVIDDE